MIEELTTKCDAFREGFKDGFCEDTVYVCYAPTAPFCLDSQHHSVSSAYHKGYALGREKKLYWKQ